MGWNGSGSTHGRTWRAHHGKRLQIIAAALILIAASGVLAAARLTAGPAPGRTSEAAGHAGARSASLQSRPQLVQEAPPQGPLVVESVTVPTVAADNIPVGTVLSYYVMIRNTVDAQVQWTTLTIQSAPGGEYNPTLCGGAPPSGTTFLRNGSYSTCLFTHTVTQEDINRRLITDRVVACGKIKEGSPPVVPPNAPELCSPPTETLNIPLVGTSPEIGLTVSPSPPLFFEAGQTITYTYTVTNLGDTDLTGVRVSDDVFGDITCPLSALAEGQHEDCTTTHVTTQAEVNSGQVLTTATVTADAPSQTVSGTAESELDLEGEPGLSIDKIPSISEFGAAGTTVDLDYLVENNGSVNVSNVVVSDPEAGPVSCPRTDLASDGDSMTCEAEETVTSADVTARHINDTATVTGTTAGGRQLRETNALSIPATAEPAISIGLSASVTSFSQAGMNVTFFYDVVNNGTADLSGVTVSDSRHLAVNCGGHTTLAPGEEMRCTAAAPTTAADLSNGRIDTTAVATGRPPSGQPVTGRTRLSIPAINAPAVSIVKTASTLDFSRPGQTVTYFYLVTNNGNADVQAVAVADSSLGRIACPQPALRRGQAMICTATHVITGADASRGSLANTARVTARTSAGVTLTADTIIDLARSLFFDPASPIPPTVAVTG